MSILYPINKPVSADDVSSRAVDLLSRGGEWNPWEIAVLETVRDAAAAVHGHYMRHVWFEIEGLGQPDPQAARDDVLAGTQALLGRITPDDAGYASVLLTARGEVENDPARGVAAMLVHAGRMVDAIMEGLRRGPGAIQDEEAHGVSLDDWHDVLKFDDETSSPEGAWSARSALREGLRTMTGNIADDQFAVITATMSRRMEGALARNTARMAAVVDAANSHYRLPDGYRLTVERQDLSHVAVTWGSLIVAAGTRRPYGREVVVTEMDVLGEIHPAAISEIARIGRQVALVLGRDTEVVTAGHDLSAPPIWSWAGPIPVVRHIVSRLAAGEDVDVSEGGMGAGPILGVDEVPLGENARYSYDARTLDEWVTIDQEIPDDLAHACIGNPVSVVISGPLFEGTAITIGACETTSDGTELDILSPIVRLQPAPGGMTEDPETAWIEALAAFNDETVYGPRPLGDTTAG